MPSLYKRPNSPCWWLSFTVNGEERRSSTGISHHGRKRPCPVAAEILRATEERLARAKFGLAPMVEARSIKAFFVELSRAYGSHSGRSQDRYTAIMRHFEGWAEAANFTTVSEITGARAIQYADSARTTLAPVTLRSYIAFLKAAWAEAKKRNYCQWQDNPFAIKITVPKSKRTRFTDEQLAAILAMPCEPWMVTIVRIGLYTGARIDSIRNLQWEHIGLDTGVINFVKSKTGPYSCPLHPELAEYLRPIAGRGPLLPDSVLNRHETYLSGRFSYTVKKLCGFRAVFQMFRHTLSSLMAEAGIEERIAMQVTNHTDAGVHSAYTHVRASELVPQFSKLSLPAFRQFMALVPKVG